MLYMLYTQKIVYRQKFSVVYTTFHAVGSRFHSSGMGTGAWRHGNGTGGEGG